jgi:deoxyribose-phosphate aldolase
VATLAPARARNGGIPLDLGWVREARFTNRGAAEHRAATLPTRRSVKKAWQAAWLLRAITCVRPDPPRRWHGSQRDAAKAAWQYAGRLQTLGMTDRHLTVGAVAVYATWSGGPQALDGSGIHITPFRRFSAAGRWLPSSRIDRSVPAAPAKSTSSFPEARY